jgi:hypothetical protein
MAAICTGLLLVVVVVAMTSHRSAADTTMQDSINRQILESKVNSRVSLPFDELIGQCAAGVTPTVSLPLGQIIGLPDGVTGPAQCALYCHDLDGCTAFNFVDKPAADGSQCQLFSKTVGSCSASSDGSCRFFKMQGKFSGCFSNDSSSASNTQEFAPPSCSHLKQLDNSAPSGLYTLITNRGRKLSRVYCEMGLNGGGYTFLSPTHVSEMTDEELQAMITDRSNVLMRVRTANANQPYGVLQQLGAYRTYPIKIAINDYSSYMRPLNSAALGDYLYIGFIPVSRANVKSVQGLSVNGVDVTFTNCDTNPNSYIALFPNNRETAPTTHTYSVLYTMFQQMVSALRSNPSGRVMPDDFFTFMEMHQGGCGLYTQTDGRTSVGGVISVAVGFR